MLLLQLRGPKLSKANLPTTCWTATRRIIRTTRGSAVTWSDRRKRANTKPSLSDFPSTPFSTIWNCSFGIRTNALTVTISKVNNRREYFPFEELFVIYHFRLVSVDGKDYVRVIDYSNFHCRSWQDLYFPQRVVRFIRIVGTHNTVWKFGRESLQNHKFRQITFFTWWQSRHIIGMKFRLLTRMVSFGLLRM